MLPASCFLLPASCFLLPASCFLLPASCFLLPASCFLLPASCFLLRYCTRVTFYYSRKQKKREGKTTQSSLFSGRFGSQREYTCKESRVALEGGFALVTVLLLASLLMVMLVGLFFLTGEEEKRSSLYIEGERATMLVETALAEVKAKLMDGGEIPYREGVARASMAASPGLLEVRRYDVLPNRGYQVGREAFTDPNSFFRKPFAREYERGGQGDWQPANPQWIALYSQKWYAPLCRYMTVEGDKVKDKNPDYNPERVFNLNTKDNPFTPGRLYFGGLSEKSIGVKSMPLGGEYAVRGREEAYRYREGESNVERPVYVQWIPVYADTRYGAVKPDGKGNPLVGRYAYWVDVENTKVNINQIKREWEQTALGELTGVSDAGRGERKGNYFSQWGEGSKDTVRYGMEYDKPRTYQLFEDKIPTDYGVTLSYRPNYRVLEKGKGREHAIEEYEKRIFDWEKNRLPPPIADYGTVDGKAFIGLQLSAPDSGRGEILPFRFVKKASLNTLTEIAALRDPLVEKRDRYFGRISFDLENFLKHHEQAFTTYGWEEERDPLGRPKIDINAILREGDDLFDRGRGLPKPNHEGTPLQQFLARLYDKKYYFAYYPGAYPHGGKGLSFVDGLRTFTGEGADKKKYAQAMGDQLITNIIEYGRSHADPPFLDRERGIIGAKSMPYVAEVAFRVRNLFWDFWDDPQRPYVPYAGGDENFGQDSSSGLSYFPGFYGNEISYENDLNQTKRLATADKAVSQRLAYIYCKYDAFSGGIFGRWFAGGRAYSDSDNKYFLNELFSYVLLDVAFAVVNPNPLGREQEAEWEIEIDYAWFDPNRGEWEGDAYDSYGEENVNPTFFGADGSTAYTITLPLEKTHYCPYLIPGEQGKVDMQGYFFAEDDREHPLLYFRPQASFARDGRTIIRGTAVVPGELIDGFDRNFKNRAGFFQPFRLKGWRIYRKDLEGRVLYHQVPLRHPGQQSTPREFWQMTVDRDGEGPEPPPNCGVIAASVSSKYGLSSRKFRYLNAYSLEHFRSPASALVRNLDSGINKGDIALPFDLGFSGADEDWSGTAEHKGLRHRKNVAASWFSSQTIAEFEKFVESLMATIPPAPGKEQDLVIHFGGLPPSLPPSPRAPFDFKAPDNPAYFYHVEQELHNRGEAPFRGLEGKLYMPPRAQEILKEWDGGGGGFDGIKKARMDILRFILLQMKLRDEGKHHREVVRATGRSQQSTGKEEDDDFVEGMALVERLVCIDPVIGHRTGNPDLRITRNGQTYSGHFYGINGHPWRRYHYYFHHYDKDSNSPQAEVLGSGRGRPEPDRALTQFFSDPRRTDGILEPNYAAVSLESPQWGGPTQESYTMHFPAFQRRKIPLHGLTGAILRDALLTGGVGRPELGGEKGWSEVSDVEESGVNVWPYGVGMNLNFTYGNGETSQSANDRFNFRNGSFLTHAPRGELMISIGEIGMCHSGFMQRAIDLDRPPLFSSKGVKRLGAPQYGPPLNMLLDLIVPSNFQNSEGQYLSERDWNRGKYRVHSPQNPRRGTWNVNSKIAHDNYLAIREGGHGELSNRVEVFFSEEIDRVAVHPALVPSAVTRQSVERAGERGQRALDPYLSPLIRFRRGWEHWLGAIAGDYSEYRNLGEGVWNKQVRGTRKWGAEGAGNRVYDIAQGVRSFSWSPGGKQRGVQSGNKRSSLIGFDKRETNTGNLLVLGREAERGVGGHVSGDGPIYRGRKSVYPVERGTSVSMYDVTRYGIFPLYHHISEVGYSGVGEIYTALNHRNRTTSALGGFVFEEELIDEQRGGDGMLGAMSQAGFGRNASWVMVGNQASTSANVFTVHIVVQSLRDRGELLDGGKEGREERESIISSSEDVLRGIGLMDRGDEILGEQWAQVTIARLPRRDKHGEIQTDKEGAPQYDYRVLSRKIVENLK